MTAMPAAHPDQPQHMLALSKANDVRLRRADVKAMLRDRVMPVEEALDDFSTQTMFVLDLVIALPRMGRTGGRKILSANHISEFTTVGKLTTRQRNALIAALQARYGGLV